MTEKKPIEATQIADAPTSMGARDHARRRTG